MIVRNEDLATPAVGYDVDPQETAEWIESLEAVLRLQGPDRAKYILDTLLARAQVEGVQMPWG